VPDFQTYKDEEPLVFNQDGNVPHILIPSDQTGNVFDLLNELARAKKRTPMQPWEVKEINKFLHEWAHILARPTAKEPQQSPWYKNVFRIFYRQPLADPIDTIAKNLASQLSQTGRSETMANNFAARLMPGALRILGKITMPSTGDLIGRISLAEIAELEKVEELFASDFQKTKDIIEAMRRMGIAATIEEAEQLLSGWIHGKASSRFTQELLHQAA
jgi:hypothetical protein